MLRSLLKPLASLKLTIVLLAASMFLVLAGTLAQRFDGIWQVQSQYFHSWLVLVPLKIFVPFHLPGAIPFIGGYPLGLLLLLNLLAAHTTRFQYAWKRAGIVLIHAGLILLLVGEGLSSAVREEGTMLIEEGGSSNYIVHSRRAELALVDTSAPEHDRHVVVPQEKLLRPRVLADPLLPFDVTVEEFLPQALIVREDAPIARGRPRATAGLTAGWVAVPRPASGVSADGREEAALYVSFHHQGRSLGRYLLSTAFEIGQPVEVAGRIWHVSLRGERAYQPFSLHLLDFAHDKYLGTDVPRNYSSLVQLRDPDRGVDRRVLIRMNEPLYYRGITFYQASFIGDTTTILQAVRNPAWSVPYIACIIGGVGLLVHFAIMLTAFLNRRQARAAVAVPVKLLEPDGPRVLPPRAGPASALVPLLALLVVALVALVPLVKRQPSSAGGFDLAAFGRLPVSFDGRIQPLDSVARNSMKVLRQRDSALLEDRTVPAIQWLLDGFTMAPRFEQYQIFRIDHPGVLDLLGLSRDEKYFSLAEIQRGAGRLIDQANAARRLPANQRDEVQARAIEQVSKLDVFATVTSAQSLYLGAPLSPGEEWRQLGDLLPASPDAPLPEIAARWVAILMAYRDQRPEDFNREVAALRQKLQVVQAPAMRRVDFEGFYNRLDPLYSAKTLYVLGLLAAALSWLLLPGPLRRAAVWLVAGALVLHTLGLVCRVYISGRPPVTNLASSAIFIGWAAAALALGLEKLMRNGVPVFVACAIAFPTLMIADRLSLDGDTMRVLVAVLDTNFWLATHVIVITLGYAATFLAGLFGLIYIATGFFTGALTKKLAADLTSMTYGVTCFALAGSFIGTVLGGIWADQSWGRFWGWDPKENGAVLIVLANAILLHARWAGWAGQRGIAGLAVFGSIVTSWSWFGTNMLGVGLHSYGFMSGAFWGLLGFVLSQLLFIGLAALPLRMWGSFGAMPGKVAAPGR
jgi:ABC-type transport system involved in cytochrome c biogenesis permease subunit/GNAT superfamily N-acetyltransferase